MVSKLYCYKWSWEWELKAVRSTINLDEIKETFNKKARERLEEIPKETITEIERVETKITKHEAKPYGLFVIHTVHGITEVTFVSPHAPSANPAIPAVLVVVFKKLLTYLIPLLIGLLTLTILTTIKDTIVYLGEKVGPMGVAGAGVFVILLIILFIMLLTRR